jgi:hypothetical protein
MVFCDAVHCQYIKVTTNFALTLLHHLSTNQRAITRGVIGSMEIGIG